MYMGEKKANTTRIALVGSIIVAIIVVLGTVWMGQSAARDTKKAARAVSLLYLDELAGRREQVVAANLQEYINDMSVAIGLMSDEDLSDFEHFRQYQARQKTIYNLDKFAFVDDEGVIYTSQGTQDDIGMYCFNPKTISGPEISILNLETPDKKVIIAMPADLTVEETHLLACFIEIDMNEMLRGVSMESLENEATFCNIYTNSGIALSNTVLGGLAVEDNLLSAMTNAQFDDGYSYDTFVEAFENGQRGEVSFTYNGIEETLSFAPIEGTNWLLTYLIRESVISERIGSISDDIIIRSVIQSLLTIAALVAMFAFIISQSRKNAQLLLEQETAAAENRARNQELEQRLALQEQLLEQERRREQQTQMITALASDYRSVYFIDLDSDSGVCYQARAGAEKGLSAGETFRYLNAFTAYADNYITEQYHDEFIRFIQPEAVREALGENRVISYRYMVHLDGRDSYEMIRMSGVNTKDNEDGAVHAVGAALMDVDAETRKALAQNQALSDALKVAERASEAKSSFLSSMSHEIRTPMNAIIGLDNIALNDPETPEHTRDYLRKIGSSAEHLLTLVNDILDMSRIESGRMVLKNEEFSFAQLLEAINTLFSGQCEERGLDYQCHINGEVDNNYIGDNMKLRQVLINILGNAVKFTPRGGSVQMDVERTAHFDGQSTLRFTISDTGIGMSEEFLPHIFDTFAQEDASATSKYGSSGLGMAITKSFVEMMNGDIEVRSVKGEGSTFVVTVTLADAPHAGEGDSYADIHPQDMRVLVVDDDPVACEHAKLVLEGAGIASEIAKSGAEAVEMVRLRHARRKPYNLILVDWQMPEMDGVETTRQIRAIIGNESAIVILTAYQWDEVLEEATQAGVDSFIPKPLFVETVIEEFKFAMKRKGILVGEGGHKADLKGRRILLAEDMQVNAEIMMMILKMREMEVDLAENGRIAVDSFGSHEPGYYDAILMDMRMPEMDGLEATRTIRAMDRPDAREIPIIALTANAFDEDVQRSLQAGLNAHLTKPVQPESLFETLESLIKD